MNQYSLIKSTKIMSHIAELPESPMMGKKPISFDLDNVLDRLHDAGVDIKKEDISFSIDPRLETPEKLSEYRDLAKNILKSKRTSPDIDMEKPAISLLARILIRYKIGV